MLPIYSDTDTAFEGLGFLADADHNLGAYGDVYTVTDLRKRARKEPADVSTNKNLDFKEMPNRKVYNLNKDIWDYTDGKKSWEIKDTKIKDVLYKYLHVKYNKETNKCIIPISVFIPYRLRYDLERPTFEGTLKSVDVDADFNKVNNYSYYIDYRGDVSREYGYGFITEAYFNELFNKALLIEINRYKDAIQRSWNKKENEKWLKYFIKFYSNPSEYDARNKGYDQKYDYFNNAKLPKGLSAPDSDIFGDVPELYNTDKLDCKGFTPTYTILPTYDFMFQAANMKDDLNGYGFDDTLTQLKDTVKNHYRECALIAKHLKADSLAQSCFNIWHWLHKNVRYNYDAKGKEQIRTPRRVWADRFSGVDCDCLSVFTYCTLLCMGYRPEFEIVAFKNRDQFSHIYVVCGNMVIDRVLPWFNTRPMFITKTKRVMIPVYELNGVEEYDEPIMQGLAGMYHDTLLKIGTHTASKKDHVNFKKAKLMLQLQGEDHNAFVLAGLLMPYVRDIGPDGGMYFDNEHVANVAVVGERQLAAIEANPDHTEEDLRGLFKKIKKALKKAAKAVGNAVKKVAQTTAKATKAVVKSAVNVTKGVVKSAANAVKATANVVKAGAQAVTGNAQKAKQTLKKAASQVKASVVQPVKAVATSTKAVIKDAVVNPTKQLIVKPIAKTVKFMGKVFKVIFVKINPVTVLMRSALRMLVSLNFVGMATRLNVANMTWLQALNAGYTKQQWEDAKKAKKRVVKFFTTMGGKAANIEKAIVKGAKKKALFKKDYKPNQKIKSVGADDATLGDPATIGSALAAVGGFIAKIWGWIKKIVPKAVKAVGTAAKKTTKAVATAAKKTAQAVKKTTKAVATAAKKTTKAVTTAAKKTAQAVKKTTKAVATAAKKTTQAVKKVAQKVAPAVKKVADNVKKNQQTGQNTANPNAKKQTTPAKTTTTGLSTGAKIGIGIGAGALLLFLVMNKKK